MLSICLAMDEDDLIGNGNKLPWNLPDDLKNFRKITLDKAIIMGRKTYESIGSKPLPRRSNIVVSESVFQNGDFSHVKGVYFAPSFESALQNANICHPDKEHICIGGASLLEEAYELADRFYLTRVHGSHEGDIYFDLFDDNDWTVQSTETYSDFTTYVLER